ncbi:hypothetical protein L596_004712 [Steinernema carpocapsae]|uniref:Uncharacterized protein n=1 Tax=Steinernema carpocapsae TaxID=34508 RepID=A0A4U8UY97_STECR|nr:hypothetical protein L596_004712 [Steinernema carpocapsae]
MPVTWCATFQWVDRFVIQRREVAGEEVAACPPGQPVVTDCASCSRSGQRTGQLDMLFVHLACPLIDDCRHRVGLVAAVAAATADEAPRMRTEVVVSCRR